MLSITNGAYIQPDGMRLSVVPALPSQSIPELIEIARTHNPTYLIAAQQVASQKLNYQYQKALTVPDLNVGPNFDRASNFTPNYVGLTLSIPIPLFNRNQGNIRSAAFNIQQQETLLASEDITLRNGVQSAYRKLALAISITGPATTAFYNDYRQLFNNIIQSYRARQISLVEFIDYLNGYEDIREKQLQQQLNIHLAKEELNYVVGIDVVK
jgi:cobalt-zinc-cadmium efflux system outer membrane protein